MRLFNTYTGNAMLNNALMTVEALAKLKKVAEISTELLLTLYQQYDLKSVNKRLKSYTMLFTKNGPLYNDPKNGLKVYDTLFKRILKDTTLDGNNVCEISGLKFKQTFEHIFIDALKDIGLSDKEIKKKDTTLNRNWFPLIGGLGSDAQSLPQAKFTVQIHPICIAIMQFLPLSSLLYKGGILLIDSTNFEFARQFVSQNVKVIQERIQSTSVRSPIENFKDYSKGNYLLQAIKILEDKKLEEEYSDLNLWSFSNSGTGASCEIDRVPNSLIKKLIRMRNSVDINPELVRILTHSTTSYKFLENLENNTEWYGLYPAVFGSGKKKAIYEGVSVRFLEVYLKEINSQQKILYAKYLAYLINKYKTPSFEKYLSKTDAWNEREYRNDLYAVLVEAAKHGEWDIEHHCEILDDPNQLPIKNFFYNIHRITHFYYQNRTFDSMMPGLNKKESQAMQVCKWIISLIENDGKKESYFLRNLTHNQNYAQVNYNELLIRSANYAFLTIEKILTVFYDEDLKISWYSINELLRIYYNQKEQGVSELKDVGVASIWETDNNFQYWKNQCWEFVEDYQDYYLDKYTNKQTGKKPFGKFLSQINDIPNDSRGFVNWLDEAVENVNNYLCERDNRSKKKWMYDDLLYNPLGETSITFARFAIKFLLQKQYYFSTINQSETIKQ
jgi:hypothetical protein